MTAKHALRVFQRKVLEKKIFRHQREEVIGCWRKLHTEELHNLYPSPDNTRVIEPSRTRLTRQVTRMGEERNAYRFRLRNVQAGDHLEDAGVDGSAIKMILKNWDVKACTGLMWQRTGTSGGPVWIR
jgi:hypothetical protein